MKNWLKFIIFLACGAAFWLLTGDVSEAILLVVILSYLEFRIKAKNEEEE